MNIMGYGTAIVLLVAFIVFAFFYRANRIKMGILAGMGVIIITWLSMEFWIIFDCLTCARNVCETTPELCGNSLCCELVVFALMIYTGLALVVLVPYLLIVAIISRNRSRTKRVE